MKNMTVAEFNRAVSRYQKQSLLACLLPLGAALACLFIYVPLQSHFQTLVEARFQAGTMDVHSALPMEVLTAVAFLALIPLGRRVERKWGISCLWCGKALREL